MSAPPPYPTGSYPASDVPPPEKGQPAYVPPAGQPQQQPYGAPPPAQPGQAPYAVQPQTVVVTQPVIQNRVIQHFREVPVQIQCVHCQAQVVTATHLETGTFAWLIAGIICIVGCWAGCCLIPFCVDGCKDVIHTCPNCRQVVGRYTRL